MRLIRFFRWILIPIAILILFVWSSFYALRLSPAVEENCPATVYASQCQDNLRKSLVKAIDSAQSSIFLVIYSFTDEKLLSLLQRRADEGIRVKVIYDQSTSSRGFDQLRAPIEKEIVKPSGLMHQKILVVDEQRVWIGSANLTTESLCVHENLLIGLHSPELAKTIIEQREEHDFIVAGQPIEFWSLPKSGKQALIHLISLLDGAKKSIRVAMFTWTHPLLTEAVIRAHQRGVAVEVILDPQMAWGVSKKSCARLLSTGVPVRLHRGGVLHHKFAWIDETILVNGSTNWTRAAFTRNWDCFLILHELTQKQQAKMKELWQVMRATSRSPNKEHFSVFRQRPEVISDQLLEPISIAA